MFKPAALPHNEAQRLARLRGLNVLDSDPEELFDSLASTAASLCEAPIALVSLIDENRQWFKSVIGVEGVREMPRDVAFCAHVVLASELMEISDASKDERFANNPLVTGPTNIQFYAGAPIRLSDGITLGSLCVIDHEPRKLADHQLETLRLLAGVAARGFESRAAAARALALAEATEARMSELYRSTPAALFSMDEDGCLLLVSDAWTTETGYSREELEGQPIIRFLTPESCRFALEVGIPTFLNEGRSDRHEYQIVCKDGEIIDVLVSQVLESDADGRHVRSMGVFENITKRKQAESELARSRELLQVTLESIGDAVVTTDTEGRVQWLNPSAERMTGWPKNEAVGMALNEIFVIVDESTRATAINPVAMCLARREIVGVAGQITLIARDGREFGIENSASPIREANGQVLGAVLTFHDVSEQRRLNSEMSHRAMHDLLTGLPNRAAFEARLTKVLENGGQGRSSNVLLYIDLDQFKLVNDACGHAAGDQLLRQISALVRGCVRGHDTLARLGGDEFGLLLEHCDAGHAQRVAQKICDQMEEFRYVHEGRRFRVGTSIGLVPIDERWTGITALLQAADASCYAAKQGGRNRVHAWLDSDAALKARYGDMQWVSRLELALDEDRFELFGQRIVPIDGAVAGLHFEVLLRMREPNGTLTLPSAFLPVAERFHLATRIDRCVVRKAFEWMVRAERAGVAIEMMSINLSGHSLVDRAFHRDIVELIRRASFDVGSLCIEITETAAITHLQDARSFIEEVRALGVKVALDDFGAGASSFGYLKSLPVDYLKIDGHFVTNILEDELNNAAVRCFCEVAKVVGVKTIAEFVEREDVRIELELIGVDMAQGYLIHKPEPLKNLIPEDVDLSDALMATDIMAAGGM